MSNPDRDSTSILSIGKDLPVPCDRRVWTELTTLQKAGYHVSAICPKGKGHAKDQNALQRLFKNE